jgi:hypothetical protein
LLYFKDIPEDLIEFVLDYTLNLEDNTQPPVQDGEGGGRGSSVSTPSPPTEVEVEVDSTMNQLIESLL